MNHLPEPLTPPDCNLRGLRWMPLDVARVIDSDLFLISSGAEFKAAFALWAKSWSQVPAASLPNDERILAGLSAAKDWKRVREVALRGWILCADGRLYHPVIAEKALEAMGKREEHAEREENEQSRQQRLRARRKAMFEQLREHGIVPAYDTKTAELERLIASLPSVTHGTQTVTGGDAGDVTGDAPATAKDSTGHDRTVNLKTIGITGDTGKPAQADSDAPLAAAQISISLIGWERERHKAARGISASNQTVIEIAEMAVTANELRKAYDMAVADRQATGDPNPVNAGFVKALIDKVRNPPKPRPKVDDWNRTPKGIERKASELGMYARPGESHDALRERCESEIRKLEREHAA